MRIVSGHDGAVIELANQRRIVLAAIGIDQQPRKIGEHRRHAEQGGQFARHRLDADVVGDVAVELRRRQAEAAIVLGQVAAGMIGQTARCRACGRPRRCRKARKLWIGSLAGNGLFAGFRGGCYRHSTKTTLAQCRCLAKVSRGNLAEGDESCAGSLSKSIGIGQNGALTCARTFPKRGVERCRCGS